MKRCIIVFALLISACRTAPPPAAPAPEPPPAPAPAPTPAPEPEETATPLPPVHTRDTRIAIAVEHYRSGAFREAVDAFRRLGGFRTGEEHFRYYFAVALYETGNYPEAQKELSCALPFIEVTEDVARYRQMIERMANLRASR